MSIKRVTAALLTAALGLIAAHADAAIISVQPAAGFRWNADGLNGLQKADGKVQAGASTPVGNVWVTPIPLVNHVTTFNGRVHQGGVGGGSVHSRLVSFSADGLFLGATTGSSASGFVDIGSQFVPNSGTLFIQSTFSNGCGMLGCTTASLNSARVTY